MQWVGESQGGEGGEDFEDAFGGEEAFTS